MSPAIAALSLSVAVRAAGVYGSGVLVDPARGIVLTCAHVLQGVRGPVTVELPGGPTEPARLLARDGALDAAFLQVAPLSEAAPRLEAGMTLRAGERLAAEGTARGAAFTPAAGWATGRSVTLVDARLAEVAMPLWAGDSGGPVVDDQGRLRGIVGYVRRGPPGIGYVIPIEDIRSGHPELFAAEGPAAAQPASTPASAPASAPASGTTPASSPASARPASTPESGPPSEKPESGAPAVPPSAQTGAGNAPASWLTPKTSAADTQWPQPELSTTQ